MSSVLLAVLIVVACMLLLIVTTLLNQNYKKDVNVRGFVGNCEKCSSFSCHKHPKFEITQIDLEEEDD